MYLALKILPMNVIGRLATNTFIHIIKKRPWRRKQSRESARAPGRPAGKERTVSDAYLYPYCLAKRRYSC